MGAALSITGQTRSSGPFSSGISLRIQSSRISSRMFLFADYGARNGSIVSRSQVVLLIIYFYSGENNFSIESPCSL